jgi:hypothetical protein
MSIETIIAVSIPIVVFVTVLILATVNDNRKKF